ncbi:MAG: dTMP kinase [Clostridia bacterium]|nr:dTMP kinase [Clostridia bacterium]
MKNYDGLLITFEGGDGSGKSTHSELLKNYLSNKGISFFATREPGGTDFSEAVRALSKDMRFADKSNISELLLFEAARADIVEKRILPALKEGKVVIMDRFYDSTTAYQSFGRGLDRKMVEELNLFAAQGLVPDLTFYMRIAPNTAFERKGGVEKDDVMETAGDIFHRNVMRGFDTIVRENRNRFVVIDSTKPVAEVFAKISSIVESKLNEKSRERQC